MSLLN